MRPWLLFPSSVWRRFVWALSVFLFFPHVPGSGVRVLSLFRSCARFAHCCSFFKSALQKGCNSADRAVMGEHQ